MTLKCPQCGNETPEQLPNAEVYCQGRIDKGYGNRHKPKKMKVVENEKAQSDS